jgi:hypothetical protein
MTSIAQAVLSAVCSATKGALQGKTRFQSIEHLVERLGQQDDLSRQSLRMETPLHQGCEEYVTLWVEYSLYPYSRRSSSFQHVGLFITRSKAFVLHNIGIVHDLNGVFFFHTLIPCHLTHFPARLHSFAPETYGEVAGPNTQAL